MMKNLRELAKEYAHNVIDKDSYRKSRNELIKGICAGEIDVEEHEYLAPLENYPEELDDTTENMVTQIIDPAKKSQETSNKPQAKPKSRPVESRPPPKPTPPPALSSGIFDQKKILIGTGIIISLCIITLIVLLFPGTDDSVSKDTSSPQVALSSAGQSLIIDFIQQRNWSQENLESFTASWQQLSDQELTIASTSPEMKRLINMIYQQLLNERSLLSLGDVENAVTNQRLLVNFAEQLRIDDERFTVIEPDAAKSIEIEVSQTDIVKTIDSNKQFTELNVVPISEAEKELQPNITESKAAVADEQPEVVVATASQVESIPIAVAESQDSLQESSIQEIRSAQPEIKSAEPETKTIIQKPVNKYACKTSLVKSRKPFCRDQIEGVGNGPTMVVIKSGEFTMGGKNKNEQPAHTVSIGSHFALSVHEISFGEYENFCQTAKQPCPKQPWSGKDYPVVNITQSEAISYADWLSQKTGQIYRLPSEAEWEYAARAGTKTEYPFGDEILISNAVFSDKKKLSAPLPKSDRSINRNKFRLYHMVGNVREWVADTWYADYSGAHEDDRARIDASVNEFVVRGGSYADPAAALRSGARIKLSSADNYTGFRVLQELSE
jgi:formylglycine-generating enzyme required for sulfatase activity